MHLYLHIPFCKQACHYCDFHFSTNLSPKAELITAICKEIELQKDYLPERTLETIYLGGGTPSLLTEHELGQLFETIHRFYKVNKGAEITLEANPDDLNQEKLNTLQPFVNRLSIGLQSFHEPYLRFMNRAHNAVESENCVKIAQDKGFTNLTIDLMYGMSEKLLNIASAPQTSAEEIWQRDLEKAVALGVPHISAYNLTIEPQTALGNWLKKGKIKPVDEEISARQFEQMIGYFQSHSYEQYEISNFARDGRYARHNTGYWKRHPYLGVGPGAHSYNGASRQYNIAHNIGYIQAIQKGEVPFDEEVLTVFDQVNDYLLTGLRTVWGCDLGVIREIAGIDFKEIQKKELAAFINKGWLSIENDVLLLTPKGKLFADRIASDLFLV